MEPIRVGVLTISDRCSRGERADESGPAIQAVLPPEQCITALYAIVPDDRKTIEATLKRWCDELSCDVILTTGGTGFGPRDITPEATRRIIDREAASLSQYLLWESLKRSPFAALSRGMAGVRGRSVIVNLPGSPTGARECAEFLLPLLPHLADVLKAQETHHPEF